MMFEPQEIVLRDAVVATLSYLLDHARRTDRQEAIALLHDLYAMIADPPRRDALT